jgi:hypothetical protein
MAEEQAATGVCDLHQQLTNYYFVISASLFFTVFAVALYWFCLKARLDGAPKLAAHYFFLVGTCKLVFAVTIWVGFQPSCPADCRCSDQPLPIYPSIALLVGLRWIQRGFVFLEQSRTLAGESGSDKDGPIFDSVSTIELA